MRDIKRQTPNKKYIQSKRILLSILFIGFIFSAIFLFHLILKGSVQNGFSPLIENSIIPPKQKQTGVGLPIRLIIPEINFNSKIENVGLIANNTMGVPKGRNDVAWFDIGTRPGNIGSAVIDGHYGWWANDGAPAVFNNLYKLHKGDYIYVEDNKGIIISFVVSKIQIYNPQSDSAKVFSSSDGKSHLNLITCEGVWNNFTKTYSNRTVVFTNKVTI